MMRLFFFVLFSVFGILVGIVVASLVLTGTLVMLILVLFGCVRLFLIKGVLVFLVSFVLVKTGVNVTPWLSLG